MIPFVALSNLHINQTYVGKGIPLKATREEDPNENYNSFESNFVYQLRYLRCGIGNKTLIRFDAGEHFI